MVLLRLGIIIAIICLIWALSNVLELMFRGPFVDQFHLLIFIAKQLQTTSI